MSAMYKDVIAKVKSDLRTEDRERADQWREMSSEQVFDAKLREAFNLYDVDHTGEINRSVVLLSVSGSSLALLEPHAGSWWSMAAAMLSGWTSVIWWRT